jgi:hypothetical protein
MVSLTRIAHHAFSWPETVEIMVDLAELQDPDEEEIVLLPFLSPIIS